LWIADGSRGNIVAVVVDVVFAALVHTHGNSSSSGGGGIH